MAKLMVSQKVSNGIFAHTLTRRMLICAAAAGGFSCSALCSRRGHALEVKDPIEEAFLFAFPVVEVARTRAIATARAEAAGHPICNILNHRPGLSDHNSRDVTTPNNDTLYSAGWLDLSGGPVELIVPRSPKRYASAQLLDIFSDTLAVFGTENRAQGDRLLIAGPDWHGTEPAGWQLVRAPYNDLWLIVRVLVDGADDIVSANSVQRAFVVRPTTFACSPFRETPGDGGDPERFLAVVNEALGRSPLPPIHAKRLARFAAAGVRPGQKGVWQQLSAQMRAEWHARMPKLRAGLRVGLKNLGTVVNGWSYPPPSIGRFGADDRNRAQVALGGLGALPQSEAVYVSTRTDATNTPLEGKNNYRLQVPAKVPVRAFWSLSMYEIDPSGRLFFTNNAIGRYAIGNRTEGLRREPDCSLVVQLQHAAPSDPANWLPAPAGPFALVFRAYLPEAELRDRRFRLPAVARA